MRAPTRRFRAGKVAEPDATFWFAKLLSTAMGESTSDYLVHRFNPELAVLGVAVVFVVVLYNQLRAPRYLVTSYWTAVVLVGVFGTMCADVLHVGFHVAYAASTPLFALILAAVFVAWYRVEGTLSIHEVTTSRRELFYWAAVVATFALGTAAGDLSAYTYNLGFLKSAAVFAVAILIPAVAYARYRVNAVACFWTAYVLTRPLGASIADYLAKPSPGRDLGDGPVALVLTALIVAVVARRAWRVARTRRGASPVPSR
ncbi:MAG: COG4705 family protein [Acidimicrobiales bacterium]